MKSLKFIVGVMFMIVTPLILMLNPKMTLAESIPIRGIVEGFYGTPWTFENRLDMLKFCGNHKLNAYIYAPKDDPYHRAKWREPYPQDKVNELKSLIQAANDNGVKFIFALSPGLDYEPSDIDLMINKLQAMYDIGFRDFAIFFDDIEDRDALKQTAILNLIEMKFVQAHSDISPLITVPTEYFYDDMIDSSGKTKTYTSDFSSTLMPEILVLYTGQGVVQPELNDEQYKTACTLYKRQLGIWWNYPVNDYMEEKLALGYIENLPTDSKIPAIFFNPMKYENLSKIALATGADYAENPKKYNPKKSWNTAIDEQFGDLAEEMKLFASYSQHLENNWAKVGPPDSELSQATKSQLKSLKKAIKKLQAKLPAEILKECRPQLEQFEKDVEAEIAKR